MGNVNSCGISPRQINGLAYTAAPFSLVPVINLQHNPTTSDRNFPLFTLARNGDATDADYGSIWYLQQFQGQTGGEPNAIWVQLSGSSGPLIDFAVPAGTSPVVPDSSGEVTLTSTAGTITITGSTNAINFDLAGGGEAIDSFIPDSGTNPVVPNAAGAVTMAGSGSITTVGGLNTLTTQLTGLTSHAVLVGAGTTTITKIAATANTGAVLQNNASADPSYSTATYPSTTVVNQILYSNATNTVTGLATANNSILVTSPTGVPSLGTSVNSDFSFTSSTANSARAVTVTNTDNTSTGSHAFFNAVTGGTSGGDPYLQVMNVGARSYVFGMDNLTSGQPLKINTGASGGINPNTGTNLWQMTSAGERTLPLQPCFLAYLASTATDKTGNGATYTLGTDALTEVFDRGSDFNTNGTFTAPVTGIYNLKAQITVVGTTIATTFVISIVTTARTYKYTFTKAAGSQDESVAISALADMTATNTATVTITVSGEAGDTDDIKGGATLESYFCGSLFA